MNIAITSSHFILFSLFWVHQKYLFYILFFLIYVSNLSNHSASMVKLLAADDILFFIAHHAKTIAGELKSDLKASLNGNLYVN